MKTYVLINKKNPTIKITTPEIEFVHTKLIDYWLVLEVGCYAASAWELKEEDSEEIKVNARKFSQLILNFFTSLEEGKK